VANNYTGGSELDSDISKTPPNDNLIVAIDGPAGAGKSSVSKQLAAKIDAVYLNTGAIYRSLALYADKKAIDWGSESQLSALAKTLPLRFNSDSGIELDGELVTQKIRRPRISEGASRVSRFPQVRESLLQLQRDYGKHYRLVAEGRDMATIVFPKAQVKVFLNASIEERANRRFKEMQQRMAFQAQSEQLAPRQLKNKEAIAPSLKDITDRIRSRDEADENREAAPLKPADDAVMINTDGKTIDDVVNELVVLCQPHLD